MRSIPMFLLLATGCAPAPHVVARVEPPRLPPAVARTVEVEVTDTTSTGAKTTHYTLALVDDNGWSEIDSGTHTERLHLKARSNRFRGEFPAVIDLELTRDIKDAPDVHVAQSTIFFAGRRTVLGHVERENSSTDIAMVTR